MNRDDSLGAIRDLLPNATNKLAEFLRNCITDGVWNIDGTRSGGDHRLDDLIEIGWIGSTGIHRRELDILYEAPCPLYHLDRTFLGFVPRHPKLVFQMDVGRGKECVNADFGRAFERFPSSINILRTSSCQAANRRPFHLLRDPSHSLEVTGRTIGKPGFDNVDA